MIRRLMAVSLFLFLSANAFAQQPPTPDEFLGYRAGDRFTSWDRILGYFDELAKKSNLITVQKFGETYEKRPLVLAVLASPANRARLGEIQKDLVSIANGEATTERAAAIAKNDPAVVWLGFGIHGNESSSAEAAMQVASSLLREPALLDNLIVIIDPLQNPDGRERYIQWFTRTRGAVVDPNPDAFEHQEPWPLGRYNHYLIDMNRDWAWLSQAETQARVAQYQQWSPQVFVDFHEMGHESTYFFPPDAKPINANLPKDVEKWLDVFGRANAAAFSAKGWAFFVGERFDLFYPGYGDSWPALHGAIGMTYEVAGHSHAGTAVRREDQTILTLADRIARHYTTGMATLRTADAHHEELVRYTNEAVQAQLAAGRQTYLVPPGAPNLEPMVELLQKQGIRVGMLTSPASIKATRIDSDAAETKMFPAGTLVINTRQPLGGFAQTLLEKSPVFTKGFVEEQRSKTQADEPDDFYDLTTWSLPLAMNVETYVATNPMTADVKPYSKAAAPAFHAASYGYLIDSLDANVYRLAGALLRAGVNFSVSDDEVDFGGARPSARGSLIVLKGSNKPDVDAVLERAARETGAAMTPLESGWNGGTAFGSEKFHFVRDPKIALVGGNGTSATSYGMLWYTLDIDTPIPHSELAFESLRKIDFSHYRVIVFPDGDYKRLDKNTVSRLQAWVKAGGTLVGVKGAGAFFRDKDVELSKLKEWEPPKKKDEDKPATDERYNQYRVPGSAFRTEMNGRSYLTFGLPRAPLVLIEGSTAYVPVSHKVDNILTIDTKAPLASGVAWPESIDRLKGSPYLVAEPYGDGQVVTFADDPNYRLFWRGTLPLFLNAVLYSPSFTRE